MYYDNDKLNEYKNTEFQLKFVDYRKILITRFQQLSALYQEIIENPKYTGRLQDDYLDCLVDCWRAIKKFYEVDDNETIRPD